MSKRRNDDFMERLAAERLAGAGATVPAGAQEDTDPVPAQIRRRSRKRKGKKFDSRYRQVTAYVPRDVIRAVKVAMVGKVGSNGKDLQFSELVESLLREWAEEEGVNQEDVEQEAG